MTKRLGQLYLAHSSAPVRRAPQTACSASSIGDVPPEQVAEYIACLLNSLHVIAQKAGLRILAEVISIAEEEAKTRSSSPS